VFRDRAFNCLTFVYHSSSAVKWQSARAKAENRLTPRVKTYGLRRAEARFVKPREIEEIALLSSWPIV